MRFGDLAARTGASVRAIRYYEEQHLLTSVRSPGGQRHHTGEQEAAGVHDHLPLSARIGSVLGAALPTP